MHMRYSRSNAATIAACLRKKASNDDRLLRFRFRNHFGSAEFHCDSRREGEAAERPVRGEDSGFRQLCYESSDDLIIFSCIYMQDNAFSYYDMGEDTEIFEVTVNGCKGKLFLPSDPTLWSTLEWIDEKSNLHFSLDACGDREAMLRLAESAAITERPADFPQPEEKEPTSMNDITGEKVEP